jgi:3'(2'), 5'-bisphosphate nucleotidase
VAAWIDHGNGEIQTRYWTIDPIDGTKGFLRGDQYAVAVALVEDGDLRLGLLACPAMPLSPGDMNGERGLFFLGMRGMGTVMSSLREMSFKPVHVQGHGESAHLRFVESMESDHSDQSEQMKVAKAIGITLPALRMDGQVKYGAVARGEAALYLRLPLSRESGYREKVWDHAAGTLIVEEAGGRVTDMSGKPLDFYHEPVMHQNRGIIASNGRLHDRVLEVLGK